MVNCAEFVANHLARTACLVQLHFGGIIRYRIRAWILSLAAYVLMLQALFSKFRLVSTIGTSWRCGICRAGER